MLVFVVIISLCCYKRAQKSKALYRAGGDHARAVNIPKNRHLNGNSLDSGQTDNSNSNGSYEASSPVAKTKLLHENENRGSPNAKRPQRLNFENSNQKQAQINIQNMHTSPKKSTASFDFEDDVNPYDEHDDVRNQGKKPVVVAALHKNSRFKNAKQDKDQSNTSLGTASQSTSSSYENRPVPPIPQSGKSRSPERRKKEQSGIRQTPNNTSSSDGPSSSEFAHNQKPKQSLQFSRDESPRSTGGKKSKNKNQRLGDYQPGQGSGNFQKNQARASKRAQKSPRLGGRGEGLGRSRGRSIDGDGDSRPGTPTSMMDFDEDLPRKLTPLVCDCTTKHIYEKVAMY